MVDRLVRGVEFLLQRSGIELVAGEALLRDERTVRVRTADGESLFAAEAVILASGSRAADLPFLKADGIDVVTSTEALAFEAPPKSLLVVGAGAIGLEMGTIYARLGTEVTVLEILPQILPGSDRELAGRLELLLKRQGLKIQTQMRIEAHNRRDGLSILSGTNLKNGAPFEHKAERVLVAAGRKPNSDGIFEAGPARPARTRGVPRRR